MIARNRQYRSCTGRIVLWAACVVVVSAPTWGQMPDGTIRTEPRTILWAVPGEIRIDPLTGQPRNPHVRDRDWRKGNSVWSAQDKTVRLA